MSGQEARYEKLLRLLGRIKTARVHEIWYSLSTRLRGLDFAPNSAEELGLEAGCKGHSGTGGPELMSLLKKLNIPRNWSAIDIGSGKGAACFTLAKCCDYVVGIEVSRQLFEVANMNLRRIRCPVRFMCMDAREFVRFDQFRLIYMANPYSVEIAKVVMGNLRASLEKHPRPCIIILKHPGDVTGYVDETMFRKKLVHQAPGSTPFHVFERIEE